MAHMSYTGASVAAPASGTDKSYVFFRAMFDHILATFNADDDTLAGATSGTGVGVGNSQLVKRDAKGGANFGANLSITNATLSAVAPDASTYALYLRVFAGGQKGIRIQSQDGTTDLFTAADPTTGNVTLSGQLIAGSGSGTTITDSAGKIVAAALNTVGMAQGGLGITTAAAGTTIRSTGSAWAAVAGLIFPEIVSDYRLAASGVAGQVNVSAGSQYGDSLGGIVGPLGVQAVVLPAQPTGTNVQYHMISLVPGSGAPHVDSGPASATGLPLPTPAYTVGNAFVGTVKRRGATTNPSDLIIASDITNALVGAGGGGGTGGASGSIAAVGWTNGAPGATMPNGLNSNDPSANGFHNANLIKYNLTDASILNIIKSAVTGNVVDHVGAGGGSLVLTINPNSPVSVALTGYGSRTNTSTTTTTNSLTAGVSSAGVYYLVADLTTALVSTFTTQIVSSIGAGQTALTAQYWDGNQFQLGGAGNFNAFIAYPFLPNPLVRPIVIPQQGWTPASVMPGSAGAYTNLLIPNSTPYTVYLPLGGMRMDLVLDAWITYGSSVADFYLGAFATAAAAIGATLSSSIHASGVGVATASTPVRHFYRTQLTNVGPGPVTAQPGYANGSANTAAFQVTGGQSFFWGEVNRQ